MCGTNQTNPVSRNPPEIIPRARISLFSFVLVHVDCFVIYHLFWVRSSKLKTYFQEESFVLYVDEFLLMNFNAVAVQKYVYFGGGYKLMGGTTQPDFSNIFRVVSVSEVREQFLQTSLFGAAEKKYLTRGTTIRVRKPEFRRKWPWWLYPDFLNK